MAISSPDEFLVISSYDEYFSIYLVLVSRSILVLVFVNENSTSLRCAAADVDVLCMASWREDANTYALWRLSGPGFTQHDGGYRCVVSYVADPLAFHTLLICMTVCFLDNKSLFAINRRR